MLIHSSKLPPIDYRFIHWVLFGKQVIQTIIVFPSTHRIILFFRLKIHFVIKIGRKSSTWAGPFSKHTLCFCWMAFLHDFVIQTSNPFILWMGFTLDITYWWFDITVTHKSYQFFWGCFLCDTEIQTLKIM